MQHSRNIAIITLAFLELLMAKALVNGAVSFCGCLLIKIPVFNVNKLKYVFGADDDEPDGEDDGNDEIHLWAQT